MSVYEELTFAPVYVVAIEGEHDGIFRAHKGRRLIASARRPGRTLFVGASRMNNSITDFADTPVLFPGGWVTLIYNGDGGTGQARYQPAPFSASDDVIALEPLSPLASEASLLLIASMLTQQCVHKFNFGYKLTLERLGRQKIVAPVIAGADGEFAVDWAGLERLGKSLLEATKERIRAVRSVEPTDEVELPTLTFAPMFIDDVFVSFKSSAAWRDKVNLQRGVGRNLYLSQTRSSNGVAQIVADQDIPLEEGNCITMTLKTQSIFYQPSSFYNAQNFLILRHPELDRDNGMVLVTTLRKAAEKFSWGYGISMGRMRRTKVMVPAILGEDGKPTADWDGMRRYGRALRIRAEQAIAAPLAEVPVAAKTA